MATAFPGCSYDHSESSSPAAWAYPSGKPGPEPSVAPGTYHIPDSKRSFTADQLNGDDAMDWIPEDHPAPPQIIWHMRVDGPIPCAACHYFNGKGFLEIPDLAGLPKAYIIEQVQEFRSGRRRSYQKNRSGTGLMIGVAKRLTDSELDAAADYYSRLSRRPWFRIVETNSVPSTTATYFGWLEPAKDRGTEPIKGRIIELPENWDRSWVEDPHSGVIAYIAPGSAKRGEALVHASGNGFAECSSCHGSDLRGDGNVPSIAGRSPAYISRMLWDMKTGARSGPVVALMQPVVQRLTGPNITDIAAYLVSLQP